MKKEILNTASKLGVGQETLAIHEKITGSEAVEFSVDSEVREKEISQKNTKGRILIPYVRGGQTGAGYVFGILSHIFQLKGYQVDILMCQKDFSYCNNKKLEWNDSSVCEVCIFKGKHILDKFGLEHLDIGDILSECNYPGINEILDGDLSSYSNEKIQYKGIEISRYAKSSTRKYLKKHHIDMEKEPDKKAFQGFLQSAIMNCEICFKLLSKKDYDAIIGFDPVYNVSGIYLDIGNKNNIPSYSIGKGYRDGHLIFGRACNRVSQPQFEDYDLIQNYISKPLNDKQYKKVQSIMNQRSSGKSFQTPNFEQDNLGIDIDKNKTYIGMFTNLIWDGSLEVDTSPITDVYDWIFSTINHFEQNREFELLVRTHPAESVRGTNESVAEQIKSKYHDLPSNITIIPANTEVNTYDLFEIIDCGIVYNSTVGLEMAYHGIPVIVGGDTHYRGLGFTYDPETLREYMSYLDDVDKLSLKKEQKDLAIRYAHFLFFKKHIPFEFIEFSDMTGQNLSDINKEDMSLENNHLDNVCDSILKYDSIIR